MAFFKPDGYFTAISAIDLDALWDAGFRCLLLDLDNTLLPRDSKVVPQDVRQWLSDAREKGFSACVVSNNWHASALEEAAALDLPAVHKAMKPFPAAFVVARRRMGFSRDRSIAIGDQLMTDVLGAHLSGMKAIKVVPQSFVDLAHTRFLRMFERLIMGDREPER